MKTSNYGINIIKAFEGFRLSAYPDSTGIWTIGYGSTHGVYAGMVITAQQADQMLRNELGTDESFVTAVVKETISQKMFDALISFTYNVGEGNFQKSSLLRLINLGDFISAADAMLLWNKAGGITVQGLVNRRNMERTLFLQGVTDLKATPVVAPVVVDSIPEVSPVISITALHEDNSTTTYEAITANTTTDTNTTVDTANTIVTDTDITTPSIDEFDSKAYDSNNSDIQIA